MSNFKVGDFIKKGNGDIGIVAWTKNDAMNLKEEDGRLGINLLTHSRAFSAPVKAEECVQSSLVEVIGWYSEEINRLNEEIKRKSINKNKMESLINENELLKKTLKLYI